jgi:hypothetical protein
VLRPDEIGAINDEFEVALGSPPYAHLAIRAFMCRGDQDAVRTTTTEAASIDPAAVETSSAPTSTAAPVNAQSAPALRSKSLRAPATDRRLQSIYD